MAIGSAAKEPHEELEHIFGVEEHGGASAVGGKPCTGLRAYLVRWILWPSPPALPRRCQAEQLYIFELSPSGDRPVSLVLPGLAFLKNFAPL